MADPVNLHLPGVSAQRPACGIATLKRRDVLSKVPSPGEGDRRRALHVWRGPFSRAFSGRGPTTVVPAHHLGYVPWYRSDSEPFHPAEPDPTLDGPAVQYAGTIPVSARINTVSTFAPESGGAIEIDHLTGPVIP